MPLVFGLFERSALARGATAALVLTTLAMAGCSAVSAVNPFDNNDAPKTVSSSPAGAGALGVNSYLWRATLDTLSFMPLLSADPYGGVVITDWYVNPEKPDERFKGTVYILDTRLRADGLNVTVFKQTRGADGQWVDTPASDQTEADIENAILTRARQLRLSNING
jgi:hypothetical protein